MALSLTCSKLLSSPTTAVSLFSSSLRVSSFSLKFRPQTLKSASIAVAAGKVRATIAVGDKLPDATFSFFDAADELHTTTVADLTAGKKAVLFAVPGAFTPTCSQKHVPGFVAKSAEIRSRGVDTIACLSVNDAFVLKAWKKDLGIADQVLLLSDGNGDFTRAIGAELDLRDKPVGLGVRSKRYAMLVEDGVVKVLNLEEGGSFTFSSAEDILKVL